MIRAESEETQDCVLERRRYGEFSQGEVEKIGRVPNAASEPRGATHWCDSQCTEDGFKFHDREAKAHKASDNWSLPFWKSWSKFRNKAT